MSTGQANQLKTRHAELETIIHKENRRPLPDELYLHQLKSEKLRIKDAITKDAITRIDY